MVFLPLSERARGLFPFLSLCPARHDGTAGLRPLLSASVGVECGLGACVAHLSVRLYGVDTCWIKAKRLRLLELSGDPKY